MHLSILYRGPLSSCNYGCPYCPFAKHRETLAEHRHDERALTRFTEWVSACQQHATISAISVFFTPWGEALIHGRYQRAFQQLTHMPHVRKVTIQTNLACRLQWVEACDKSRMALWATYHPGEVSRTAFVDKVRQCVERGVALSVGVVGLKEHADEIEALRREIPDSVYVWINAYKRIADYYSPDDLARYTAIDPLFMYNTVRHASEGKPCHAGETVISVDGEGNMRRCHFIKPPIGNIYDANFAEALKPRLCSNATCGCHIGYVHMPELGLHEVYGEGLLERIPQQPVWRRTS